MIYVYAELGLLRLHGLDRLLHDCQAIDIAISLPEVLIVARLDLVSELYVLPLDQFPHDFKVGRQFL